MVHNSCQLKSPKKLLLPSFYKKNEFGFQLKNSSQKLPAISNNTLPLMIVLYIAPKYGVAGLAKAGGVWVSTFLHPVGTV
jgi:hypothetical protein